ncbi:MAG: 4Fe-4S single cluster domain-containing protein [Anaerolineaceae bacterium]|nr:4Fe-4S single cluster domain-containing protein [Anaerolineaceae bacterium]
MKAIISHINLHSFVDGPGERVVVFFSGCPIHCPGCQNRNLWESKGHIVDATELGITLKFLANKHGNVTITGGEPFFQPRALAELVTELRKLDVKNIQVYSGYTWEELTNPLLFRDYVAVKDIFQNIDVLVDGQFVVALDNPFLVYRGSSNQRPIDVQASLEKGEVVVLDWDNPEIQIDLSGDVYMPAGLAPEMAELGDPQTTRRCGQSK